jgi:hypothetical protein
MVEAECEDKSTAFQSRDLDEKQRSVKHITRAFHIKEKLF